MSVGAYCLTTSENARMYAGSGEANALWIYCNSPASATAATVEVQDGNIVLIITGGASAGTSTISLTAAATDTLTELVAAINALALPSTPTPVYPWKAGLLYYTASPSTNLIVTGAQSCLGSTNEITLRTETTYETDLLADRATDFLERYTGRRFKSRSYDREVYCGKGNPLLLLRNYPCTRVYRVSEGVTNTFYVTNITAKNFATVEINSTQLRLNADGTVTSLTLATYATINLLIAAINATSGWAATLVNAGTRAATYTGSDGTSHVSELVPMTAQRCMSPNVAYVQVPNIEVDDYTLRHGGMNEETDAGILYRAGGWANGETFFVDYLGGWTTIPAALEEACLMLVKYAKDKQTRTSGISSESLGDYAWSANDMRASLPEDVMAEVKMFRAFEF